MSAREAIPQLGERLVQMVGDGARADEQLSGDVAVGASLGHEPHHLRLLRCEPDVGGIAGGDGLSSGAWLGGGAIGPGCGAEPFDVSYAAVSCGRDAARRRARRSHSP